MSKDGLFFNFKVSFSKLILLKHSLLCKKQGKLTSYHYIKTLKKIISRISKLLQLQNELQPK